MKKFLACSAVFAVLLLGCGDDSSTPSQATSGNASNIRSSCEFDESFLEEAASVGMSLKKMVYDDSASEHKPERYFTFEERGDSVQVSVSGLVDACNRLIRDIDVRIESDTLYATMKYDPNAETDCLCFWVDLSFMVAEKFIDDSVKTLVIGEEIFERHYKIELINHKQPQNFI